MIIQSRKIFIDSSVFVAFIDRGDSNHPRATKALEELAKKEHQLYASSQNIIDAYAVLSRELGVSMAQEFLSLTLQSNMEILFPQKADFITAFRVVRGNTDRQISLREALNVTLMQKRGIPQVITFTYWHNLLGTNVANLALI